MNGTWWSSFVQTRYLFANNEIYKLLLQYSERKEYLEKMNKLPKHHCAGPPEARGPQRRGAQCSRIGCISLRPALGRRFHKSDLIGKFRPQQSSDIISDL